MLWQEMKKIWRPSMIAVLLILGFVFYHTFLSFFVHYFPNGPYFDGLYRIAGQWVQTHGPVLSAEAEAQEKAGLAPLEAEADKLVAANPLAQQYGLSTFAQYQAFYDQYVRQVSGELTGQALDAHSAAMRLSNYLQSEETGNIEGRLLAVADYTQSYEDLQHAASLGSPIRYPESYTQREYDHAMAAFFGPDQAWRNMLPEELPRALSTYIAYVLIWCALSICLLLSPFVVRDRSSRMRQLQYASRHGRRILRTQCTAALLSALLLTTLNLLIFGGLFAAHGIAIFFSCRLYSFMLDAFAWFNWPFGLWCLILCVMGYLISLGVALLAFLIAQYSDSYVAMLLKLLPLFILTALLLPGLFVNAFYYSNMLYRLTHLPGIEALLALAIAAAGTLLCAWSLRQQQSSELLGD